jgi:type IV secretion system protein VirD4
LLQAEDIRALTGGELGLLEARDSGFFSVEMPEFWHRPELSGYLRDVRRKPGKYDWLDGQLVGGRSGPAGNTVNLLPYFEPKRTY